MEKLKYAQDLIKSSNRNVLGGFNSFISGRTEPKAHEYGDKTEWYARLQGYQYAEKTAKEDGIGLPKPFKYSYSSNCYLYEYGE